MSTLSIIALAWAVGVAVSAYLIHREQRDPCPFGEDPGYLAVSVCLCLLWPVRAAMWVVSTLGSTEGPS